MKKIKQILFSFFSKHNKSIIILALLLCSVFFRFYDIEGRSQFTWDQVENAWMAKNIILDHRFPILGMQAKLNSGFSIGPLYYYLITPFYFFTKLDPIASGIFAGITSIFTFFVIYFFVKKMFSFKVAAIAVFIYTFSMYIIESDRIQWPVNFIAPVSLIIFFALYKIISGKEKYLLLLGLALGFSFNIHFTAVFFVLAAILCLPFFPRKKETLLYGAGAIFLMLLFLLPNIYMELATKNSSSHNLINYLHDYYHGFHLVRVKQIAFDAFIEFEAIFGVKIVRYIEFLFPVLFMFFLFKKESRKKAMTISFLVFLWLIIPWFAFATYKGEISNYYFSMTRPVVLIVFSYLLVFLYTSKIKALTIISVFLLILYGTFNIQKFFTSQYQGLGFHRKEVEKAILENKKINFTEGVPESYIYYIYTREKKN